MILLKFNEDLWPINDNETSLPKTQEAADKMITITSLPLLQLSQWPCKPNSKKCPKLTCQFEASSSSSSSKKSYNKSHPTLLCLSLFTSNIPLYHPSLPHTCNYSTKVQLYVTAVSKWNIQIYPTYIKFYSDYPT